MDIVRKDAAKRRWIRRIVVLAVVLVSVPLITVALWRLEPAAPLVEASTVWPDTVKRGPMIRNVHGLGTLVPEDILWIPAVSDGRVERILLRPGALVKPTTILMTLSNPQLDLDALDAEYQVKAAEATLADLRVKLESERLNQQAEVARIQSEQQQAKLQADRDAELLKLGLTADLTYKLSRNKAEELEKRLKVEEERLKIKQYSTEALVAVQRATIDKLKALQGLKKNQQDQLKVRAGTEGVLQEVPVQEGQRVPAGTVLAKIVQPQHLKAELKIAETQVKEVMVGQAAEIELPQGARPDLNVDGTVELEKLADVVQIQRPAFGQPNSTVQMFKYDKDGKTAHRVQVKFGRSSVNNIEVLEGLQVGEKVILSDMTAWDSVNKIRLN
jgi:HlyD family secretion protein